MKLNKHIISSILLGLCTLFALDLATHAIMGLNSGVIEHSHVAQNDHTSVPELAEENLVQEYIAPKDVFEGYHLPHYLKSLQRELEESFFEHNVIVPPPDHTS